MEQDGSCSESCAAQALPSFCAVFTQRASNAAQGAPLSLSQSTAACWAEAGRSSLQAAAQTGMSFFFFKVCC